MNTVNIYTKKAKALLLELEGGRTNSQVDVLLAWIDKWGDIEGLISHLQRQLDPAPNGDEDRAWPQAANE